MKKIFTTTILACAAFVSFGQKDPCSYGKVRGQILYEVLLNVNQCAAALRYKWQGTDSLISAKALQINNRAKATLANVSSNENYSCSILAYLKNYRDILSETLDLSARDSILPMLNYIVNDLTLKTEQKLVRGYEMATFLINNTKTVKVSVIQRSTGKHMNFFEVQVHPYFLRDPASIIRFGRLTDSAVHNIYPGWYKCWATDGHDTVSRTFTINEKSVQPLVLEIPLDNKKK